MVGSSAWVQDVGYAAHNVLALIMGKMLVRRLRLNTVRTFFLFLYPDNCALMLSMGILRANCFWIAVLCNKKILVAMSGGVDSSVAALKLKNCRLMTWLVSPCASRMSYGRITGASCSANRAVDDARRVCRAPGHQAFCF